MNNQKLSETNGSGSGGLAAGAAEEVNSLGVPGDEDAALSSEGSDVEEILEDLDSEEEEDEAFLHRMEQQAQSQDGYLPDAPEEFGAVRNVCVGGIAKMFAAEPGRAVGGDG